MQFYDGQPFISSRTGPATKGGRCASEDCLEKYEAGTVLDFINWKPYGNPTNWAKMHTPCAEAHPMNKENMTPEEWKIAVAEWDRRREQREKSSSNENNAKPKKSPWLHCIQRAAIDLLHEHGHIEIIYRPHAPRDKRYQVRLIDINEVNE